LSTYGSRIGKDGPKLIADSIHSNTTLAYLGLSGHKMGIFGAKAVALAIENNSSLRSLDLFENEYGPDSAREISYGLKKNSTLEKICLNSNVFGEGGAFFFAEALAENSSLKSVQLENNNISSKGAEYIAEALKKINTSLRSISLRGNNIGDKGALAILNALKINCTLIQDAKETKARRKNCVLGDHQCSSDVVNQIRAEISKNAQIYQGISSFNNWPQLHYSLPKGWQKNIVELLCCCPEIPTEIIGVIIPLFFCSSTKLDAAPSLEWY